MSELEERIENVSTLIGLDLKLTFDPDPILVENEVTGNVWDGTIPFMLFNEDKVLLERCDFNAVSAFLSALEWIGTERVLLRRVYEYP